MIDRAVVTRRAFRFPTATLLSILLALSSPAVSFAQMKFTTAFYSLDASSGVRNVAVADFDGDG
jgi:hypothetical protein